MEIDENHWKVVLMAIVGLMLINVTALAMGVNGQVTNTIIFLIGALAGWTVPSIYFKNRR